MTSQIVLLNPEGETHITDQGEGSIIRGNLIDEGSPPSPVPGLAVSSLTMTLQDRDSGVIINDRDNANILNIDIGKLDSVGNLEIKLIGADNPVFITEKAIEEHVLRVDFEYTDNDGATRKGSQQWVLLVSPIVPQPTIANPVTIPGTIPDPLTVGDSYLEAIGNAFVFFVAKQSGFSTAATVTFSGSECEGASDNWATSGTITEIGNLWRIACEMTSQQTEVIRPGNYNWTLTIAEGDRKITIRKGQASWVEYVS